MSTDCSSANFFASLFGLTLKPINKAFEALANETSVSFIIPMSERIILGSTSSFLILLIAFFKASLEP